MDDIDQELADLLSTEKVFRGKDYQYFVLSNDPAPRTAQIFVSRDATMTPEEISAQLRRLADFVLKVGQVW